MPTPRQLVTDYDASLTIRDQDVAAEAAAKDGVTAAQAILTSATAKRQADDQDVAVKKSNMDSGLPESVPYPFSLNGKNVIVINLHGDAKILPMGDPDADLTPPSPPVIPIPEPTPTPAPAA